MQLLKRNHLWYGIKVRQNNVHCTSTFHLHNEQPIPIESMRIIKILLLISLGEAAKYILREEFGDNWKENVKVIFAGDDTTDEDAMRVNVCTRISLPIYLDPISRRIYQKFKFNQIYNAAYKLNVMSFCCRH